MKEAEIQRASRLALGELPWSVWWRNNVGLTGHSSICPRCGYCQPDLEDGPHIRYGLCKGSSDLIGMVAPSGRLGAIEFKVPGGRVTSEQQMFLELVRRMGGFAAVTHSPEESVAAAIRAREGASE